MNYVSLIGEAWATTWRYRFLWILGLFAGVTGGTMELGRSSWPDETAVRLPQYTQQVEAWISSNVSLVIGLAIVAAAIAVMLTVLSVIARGGITQATIDLQSGQPMSLGEAWRAGRRWFWRFLGLLVLLGVLVATVGGSVALAVQSLGGAAALLGAVALSMGVIASIVLAYAERAIVSHDLGPLQALRYGWSVFERNVGASLVTWLLSVALSVATGIVAGLAVGITIMLFGGIGFVVWLIGGLGTALLVNAGLAIAAVIAALIALAAIANTFFWSYWTVAYLRLDARPSTS